MENQQRFNFKLRITLEHNFVYKLNLSPPYGRFNNEKKFILRSENSYIYYMYRLMVLSKVKTSSTNKKLVFISQGEAQDSKGKGASGKRDAGT